jgi:hypothetical protein
MAVPQAIGISLADMKTGAIVIATAFVVAAFSVAAIKFLRKAGYGSAWDGAMVYWGNLRWSMSSASQVHRKRPPPQTSGPKWELPRNW